MDTKAYIAPDAEVIGLLPLRELCTSSGGGGDSSFGGAQGTPGGGINDGDVEDGGSF